MIRACLATAAAIGAMALLSACGGDDSGAPAPGASASPTPTPTSAGIPPRTQTTTYAPGFSPDRDRQLEGFQLTVFNTQTGATLPGGGPVIDSSVSLAVRGPRSSDGERFTGGLIFTASTLRSAYIDLANNSAPFNGEASAFVSRDGAVEWTVNSLDLPPGNSRLVWSRADPFNQIVPQFYSRVLFENQDADQVRKSKFLGGSLTDENDVPPSGLDRQRARIILDSDEPGDGSYRLVGEADLLVDYTSGGVTGTFLLQPAQNSLAQPLTLTLSGTIDRARRWVRGGLSGSGTGGFAGAMFGPYAGEIAASVRFERENGQSYFGDLEARRP